MKHLKYFSHNYHLDNCRIHLFKHDSKKYSKVSYPLRCGIYSEIETDDFIFHFNLNHEIIRASGKGTTWRHPHEWLKRTAGNDWVYYSTGGYTGVFETTGEYYLPNLPYPTNKHTGGNPFQNQGVCSLISEWHPLLVNLRDRLGHLPAEVRKFLDAAIINNPDRLSQKAQDLFTTCDGRASVLPPDTRHVDYNVIPLTVSRGCLYKCRFCRVKNDSPFAAKSHPEITEQIDRLQSLYLEDLPNYNSIFLGEHDSLQAGSEMIRFSIEQALSRLNLTKSYIDGANIFFFGSVSSLLNAPRSLFHELDELPVNIYINIGLESADQETLDMLGKPLTTAESIEAFDLIQDINDQYASIEITANFVIDDRLNRNHYKSLLALIRDRFTNPKSKGCVYLSPLRFDNPSRSKLFDFYRLKVLSRVPLFLYTIQRL